MEYWLKLSKSEINHLLNLIDVNERDGWYFSPKNQYWNRSKRIKDKLVKFKSNQEIKRK